MNLKRNYWVHRLLKQAHHPALRWLVGLAVTPLTWFITHSNILARASWRDCKTGQLKIALRRLGWYAGTRWKALGTHKNHFVDFTEGLNKIERLAARHFLNKHHKNQPNLLYAADELFFIAADLHAKINTKLTPLNEAAQFYNAANKLLQSLPALDAKTDTLNKHITNLKTPSNQQRKQTLFVNAAHQALRDWADLFSLDTWNWYVISGTFLGLIRENGFLPNDYDIDLGINAEQCDINVLHKRLQESNNFLIRGFDQLNTFSRSNHYFQVKELPVLIKVTHKTGVNIDIFFHYLDKNGTRWHGSRIQRWNNTEFALNNYVLEGIPVLGPADANNYLTENYGNWRIPATQFDSTTGTPNLQIAPNFIAQALFLKGLVVFSNTQPQQAYKLCQRLIASNIIYRNNETNSLQMSHYV